jgi:hypothetical protein
VFRLRSVVDKLISLVTHVSIDCIRMVRLLINIPVSVVLISFFFELLCPYYRRYFGCRRNHDIHRCSLNTLNLKGRVRSRAPLDPWAGLTKASSVLTPCCSLEGHRERCLHHYCDTVTAVASSLKQAVCRAWCIGHIDQSDRAAWHLRRGVEGVWRGASECLSGDG